MDAGLLAVRFAGGDVDVVVTRAVMGDPLDARRESRDDLLVEDTDAVRRYVVAVHADDARIFPAWLEIIEKVGAVGRVHRLYSLL